MTAKKITTPNDIRQLVVMYSIYGMSRQAISERLGTSIYFVDKKIRSMHLTRRTRPLKVLPKSISKQPYLKSPEDFMKFLGLKPEIPPHILKAYKILCQAGTF